MLHNFSIKSVVFFALASGVVPGQSAKPITNVEYTNGAKAAVVPALANAAPGRLHNLIKAAWPPKLAGKEPIWRTSLYEEDVRQMILRWDHRGPEIIFKEGFAPESKHQDVEDFDWDVVRFAGGYYFPSEVPYVSTTLPYFAENGELMQWTPSPLSEIEYLYEIFAPGGLDLRSTLRELSPNPELREIAFPGGIRPEFIRSVRVVGNIGPRVKYIVVNARFTGVDGLPNIRIPFGNMDIVTWDSARGKDKDMFSATFASHLQFSPTFVLDPMKRPGKLKSDFFPDYPKSDRRIPDGFFRIAPLLNAEKVINSTIPVDAVNGDPAVITTDTGGQELLFTYDADKKAYLIRVETYILMAASNLRDIIICDLQNTKLKRAHWKAEWLDSSFVFHNYENTSLVLKLASPTPLDGTKLKLGEPDSSMTHKWRLKPPLRKLLSDGEYQICSSWFPNKVAFANQPTDTSPEQPALLMENYRNGLQEYKFVYNNKLSAYSIQDASDTQNYLVRSQKTSDVAKSKVDELAVGQYWKVESVGGKSYRLRTNDNLTEVWHLSGGYPTEEAAIIVDQAISRFSKGENWLLQRVVPDPVAEGTYEIKTIANLNQLINCRKPTQGATRKFTVDMFHHINNDTQQWKFQYYSAKRAYRISNVADRRCVLVSDISTGEVYGDDIPGDNSYWKIETADGYYILRNLIDTSRSLYLPHGDAADEAKLDCSRQGGHPFQLWRLHRRDVPFKPLDDYVMSKCDNSMRVWVPDVKKPLVSLQNWPAIGYDWLVKYDAKKAAYSIHPAANHSSAVLYTGKNAQVNVKFGGSDLDLQAYWLIEYNVGHGGYVFRSLYDPEQAIDTEEPFERLVTRPVSHHGNQTFKMSRRKYM